ncbi:cilia- and flagella-associated protein 58-like protein [Lates japonicus]|uniref:Cilia- and flagella-associated protein 58-like protein n=1 Tax=Lates japonicus TaxID=270547 RepID=A0AAD3MVF5_LATJO|nr:cilia- and flagella-associated protein 58-like protein [Lates japonicus]
MTVDQQQHALKEIFDKLNFLRSTDSENNTLRLQLSIFQKNEEENKHYKKLLFELRKQLQVSNQIAKTCKDDHKFASELQEQVRQLTQENDILRKQLVHYKHECLELKKKNKDLEVTTSEEKRVLLESVHILQLEVEELKRNNSTLENKLLNVKIPGGENSQKDKALLLEKTRNYNLEREVERARKDIDSLSLKRPTVVNIQIDSNNRVVQQDDLREKLLVKTQKLTKQRKELEKKDRTIAEKEQQCEELRRSMSRLLPPERLEEIPKYTLKIRELNEETKALKGQLGMFQQKNEEYKGEKEKLVDKIAAIKKMYFGEKRKNMDLMEVLRKYGAELPAEDKSGGSLPKPALLCCPTCLSPISTNSQLKSEAKSAETQTLTFTNEAVLKSEKKTDITPIKTKSKVQVSQLDSNNKKVHTQTSTVTKKAGLKSDEKTPMTKRIHGKDGGFSNRGPLPPISRMSRVQVSQLDSDNKKVYPPAPTVTKKAGFKSDEKTVMTKKIQGKPGGLSSHIPLPPISGKLRVQVSQLDSENKKACTRVPKVTVKAGQKSDSPPKTKTICKPKDKSSHSPLMHSKSAGKNQTKIFMTETDLN